MWYNTYSESSPAKEIEAPKPIKKAEDAPGPPPKPQEERMSISQRLSMIKIDSSSMMKMTRKAEPVRKEADHSHVRGREEAGPAPSRVGI